MNIFRTTAASHFLFDEAASGQGSITPPSSSGPDAGTASPDLGSSAASGSGAGTEPAGSSAEAAPASDPFSGLDLDLDEVYLPDETATAAGSPAPGEQQAAPQTPPAAQPPAAPPQVPAQQQAAPPATENAPQAGPRSPLDETIEGFKNSQKELSTWAAQNLFKLSDEEAASLETDATSAIPVLMGKVYTQALAAAANLIRNFGPQIARAEAERFTQTTTKAKEAIDEFYGSHKALDRSKPEVQQAVDKWVRAFRSTNPKASRADAIKFVGHAVKTELGISDAPQAAPAARPAPFVPAPSGGRGPVAQQTLPDPYAGLDFDFDE